MLREGISCLPKECLIWKDLESKLFKKSGTTYATFFYSFAPDLVVALSAHLLIGLERIGETTKKNRYESVTFCSRVISAGISLFETILLQNMTNLDKIRAGHQIPSILMFCS